jgi:NADPH:quinone reductase-like Zn-dependent oxidoreductase
LQCFIRIGCYCRSKAVLAAAALLIGIPRWSGASQPTAPTKPTSGGVSTFVLMFAKAAGVRVTVTTSDEAKAARLRALGADIVIDRRSRPSWGEAVREATDGAGADLIVEAFGADTIEESMQAIALAPHRQIIVLIARGAVKPEIVLPSRLYGATMVTIRRVFVGNRDSFEAMNRSLGLTRHRTRHREGLPLRRGRGSVPALHEGRVFRQNRHRDVILALMGLSRR